MSKTNARISDFYFDHKLWMNELKFFEKQLDVFEERLEEIVLGLENPALENVEVFQNKITRQREVIDELKHKLRMRHRSLRSYDRDHQVSSTDPLFAQHRQERAEMQMFIKLYQDMRSKYMSFLEAHG